MQLPRLPLLSFILFMLSLVFLLIALSVSLGCWVRERDWTQRFDAKIKEMESQELKNIAETKYFFSFLQARAINSILENDVDLDKAFREMMKYEAVGAILGFHTLYYRTEMWKKEFNPIPDSLNFDDSLFCDAYEACRILDLEPAVKTDLC